MTEPTSLLGAAILLTAFLGLAAVLLLRAARRQDVLAARLGSVRIGLAAPVAAPVQRAPLARLATLIGGTVARSGLLSGATLAELGTTLQQAGIRSENALSIYVGAKLLLLTGLPVAAFILLDQTEWDSTLRHGLLALAGIMGLLAPDMALRRIRKRALAALERGLPDALDLMVICSEAGLGLEPAIERVAQEIVHAHPVVADEFRQTETELRLTSDRRRALLNMGNRTGLESLRRLATTLNQSLQYGTPLSQALRMLSTEMRAEALTRFEARAARLPVLLTLPMIVFILPTIFLVVIGPAALKVMNAQ